VRTPRRIERELHEVTERCKWLADAVKHEPYFEQRRLQAKFGATQAPPLAEGGSCTNSTVAKMCDSEFFYSLRAGSNQTRVAEHLQSGKPGFNIAHTTKYHTTIYTLGD
jgi:hypothetical protein